MEGKLYKAAITEDEGMLNEVIDSFSVDGAEFVKETPLHIAAKYGRPNIVREILRRRPALAFRLNSEGQTPLHLASAKGHFDAVNELLGENNNDQSQQRKLSDACFIRDKQGRSPLHLAAMNGHVEVLRWLVQTESAAAWVVTDGGQSSLHLCADNDHFKGVEKLIGLVSEKQDFINLKDDDENNVLHLLAAKGQYKMIKHLVNENTGVDINAMNRDGDTVLDVVFKNVSGIEGFIQIRRLEESIRAKTSNEMSVESRKRIRRKLQGEIFEKWSREALLVVAILMATITFQAAVSPPGGVWQDDLYFDNKTGNFSTNNYVVNATGNSSNPYSVSRTKSLFVIQEAGVAIMSDKYPITYKVFIYSNTVGFSASVSLILLLAIGYTSHQMVAIGILKLTIWVAAVPMLVTFACSIFYFCYSSHLKIDGYFTIAMMAVLNVWLVFIFIFFQVYAQKLLVLVLYVCRRINSIIQSC